MRSSAGALFALCASVAASASACGELGGAGAKNRCTGQADCDPGYGCVDQVCKRWVDVPGVVSTEPFTGTGTFLVNLGAPGSYQVLASYDAVDTGVIIRASFGRDDVDRPGEQGTDKSFSSGAFDNIPGAYVLRIEASSGVTIRQLSVGTCPDDYLDSIRNCGECGHVCDAPAGLHYPPICVSGRCLWSGDIQSFVDYVNVRSVATTVDNTPLLEIMRGERLYFDCQVVGQKISQAGTSLQSDVWDHLPAYDGYVADLLIETGVNAMFAPACE